MAPRKAQVTVETIAPREVISNVSAIALASAFNGLAVEVTNAQAMLDAAKGKRLPAVIAACSNLLPVTQSQWDAVAPAAFKAFDAHPRFAKRDAKGVSLSARSQFSELKVCVLALTNGLKPLASDSFQQFTSKAREFCIKHGYVPAPSAAAQAKAKARAADKAKAPASDKADKAQPAAKLTQDAACHFLASGDDAFADRLALACGDYREAFIKWCDKRTLALAALDD